jgi:hypothetical protein
MEEVKLVEIIKALEELHNSLNGKDSTRIQIARQAVEHTTGGIGPLHDLLGKYDACNAYTRDCVKWVDETYHHSVRGYPALWDSLAKPEFISELKRWHRAEMENKDIKEKQEGVLEPKPPEILQKILWVLKYGRRYWLLMLLAVFILLISSGFIFKIFILPKFNLPSKEHQNIEFKTSGDSSPAIITSGPNSPVNIYISPAKSGTHSEIREPNVDQAQQPPTRDISKQQSETEKKGDVANETKNEPIIKKRALSIQPDETEGEVNLPKKGELKKRDSAIPPDENEGEVRKTK